VNKLNLVPASVDKLKLAPASVNKLNLVPASVDKLKLVLLNDFGGPAGCLNLFAGRLGEHVSLYYNLTLQFACAEDL